LRGYAGVVYGFAGQEVRMLEEVLKVGSVFLILVMAYPTFILIDILPARGAFIPE
jgi:hypothetical protein